MAKKIVAPTVAFTDAEKVATLAEMELHIREQLKGAARWTAWRALCTIDGTFDNGRKAEMAKWYRGVYLAQAAVNKGSPLTDEESARFKGVANADFSRGMRDPAAKAKAKGAQTASTAATTTATTAGDVTLVPNPVQVVAGLKDVAARVAHLQAALISFSTSVRIPNAGKPLVADMVEEFGKLAEQVAVISRLAEGEKQ